MRLPKFLFSISVFLLLFNTIYSQKTSTIDSLKTLLNKELIDTSKVNYLLNIGSHYINQKQYDSAIIYRKKALEIARDQKIDTVIPILWYFLAKNYAYKNELDICKLYIDSATIYYENNKNLNRIANFYNNLGILFQEQSNLDNAISYLNKAANYHAKNGDSAKYFESLNNRGVSHMYKSELDIADSIFRNSNNYYFKTRDTANLIESYHKTGINLYYKGDYLKSTNFFNKKLDLSIKIKDSTKILTSLNLIGMTYHLQSNYPKALDSYLKALKIAENKKDTLNIAQLTGNIGILYDLQNEHNKAIAFYNKSLEFDFHPRNRSRTYNNIGLAYLNQNIFDSALYYFDRSLKLKNQINDKRGKSLVLVNLGETHIKLNKYVKAAEYLQEALKIAKSIGDKTTESESSYKLGKAFYKMKSYRNALINTKWGYELAVKIQHLEHQKNASEILANSYRSIGDYKEALDYYQIFKMTSDSLFNEEKTKKITATELQYQFEKEKQAQLLEQEKKDALQAAVLKRQKTVRNWFIGSSLLLLLVVGLVLRNIRLKNRANLALKEKNKLITDQKNEIQEKNEELNQTNEELNATLELVNSQKAEIENSHKQITDSINYASRIQSALLPELENLRKLLPEHFILFKPRNVVSGDFYWVKSFGNHIVIVAADCTGHGVPGAFMSMLGITYLNEIVCEANATKPGDILNELRESVKSSLKQTGKKDDNKDGMDMAILSIERSSKIMHYAGANNPIYLIRQNSSDDDFNTITKCNKLQENNYTLCEIKSTKQPVSIAPVEKEFETNTIQLKPNDVVYAFSDGFPDQFGGPNERKFMSTNFKKLLLQSCHFTLPEQKEILEKTLREWQGNYEQLDDILVMGIKI